MSEPVWTFDSKLQRLDRKVDEVALELKKKLDLQYNTLNLALQQVKAAAYEYIHNELESVNVSCNNELDVEAEPSLPSSLELQGGDCITGDEIKTKFDSIHQNLTKVESQLTTVVKKFNTVGGFITTHNFRKSKVTDEQLTQCALEVLNISDIDKKALIPNGTRIKNTFDNHIWVFNNVVIDGLTTSSWADLGADTTCVATNDGTLGIVTGSQERYQGFIDAQGRITINGLEEDIQNIFKSIQNINNELADIRQKNFC